MNPQPSRNGIAAAGSIILDVIKQVSQYPARGNLTNIHEIQHRTGGLCCNCLMDLRRMDPELPLSCIGLVGRDVYGKQILNELKKLKIDISMVETTEKAGTSFTDVMSETSERTFFHYRGANALFGPEHIHWESIRARILHIGYLLLTDRMDSEDPKHGTVLAGVLQKATENGLMTSIDMVSEESGRFRDIVLPSLKHTDYCIINEHEASQVTGISCYDAAGKICPDRMRRICCTLMKLGVRRWAVVHAPLVSFGMTASGEFCSQPSVNIPQENIAGKTGAGDAFCSGVLYAAHEDSSLSDALRLGAAAAAASLFSVDASSGVLPAAELLRLYDRYGIVDN